MDVISRSQQLKLKQELKVLLILLILPLVIGETDIITIYLLQMLIEKKLKTKRQKEINQQDVT